MKHLDTAYQRYWSARTSREEQTAYHEILLFGGKDGYPPSAWRAVCARMLRRLAIWVEGDFR